MYCIFENVENVMCICFVGSDVYLLFCSGFDYDVRFESRRAAAL